MKNVRGWLGALFVTIPFAFAACGDDEDDDGGGDGSSTGARGGSTGGSVTGGRGGSSGQGGSTGGRMTGGRGGTPTGGSAGAGEGGSAGDDGGMGGDDGGMGGEAGEPQGGSAGGGMGGTGGAGTGGSVAGGGVGGAGAGGLAGGGVGGAGAGGLAGGGMAGGGMAGAGGALPTCDPAAPEVFVGVFSGAAEVPPIPSSGTGVAVAELNAAETQITVSASWTGMTSDTVAGHVHGPAIPTVGGAPILFDLTPPTGSGTTSGQAIGKTFTITPSQVADLKQSLYYANIHSVTNGGGELRAQLVPAALVRSGPMSAAQEPGSVKSSATGRSFVATFPGNTTAAVLAIWTGLTTNTYNGHVHGPAAPGASAGAIFPFFASPSPPGATTSGAIVMLWTLGGGHFDAVRDSLSYTNIHSTMYMNGEIRGQLLPACP